MPTYNFLGIHFEQVLTAVTHKKNFSFDKFQGKEKFGKFSPLRQKPKNIYRKFVKSRIRFCGLGLTII